MGSRATSAFLVPRPSRNAVLSAEREVSLLCAAAWAILQRTRKRTRKRDQEEGPGRGPGAAAGCANENYAWLEPGDARRLPFVNCPLPLAYPDARMLNRGGRCCVFLAFLRNRPKIWRHNWRLLMRSPG